MAGTDLRHSHKLGGATVVAYQPTHSQNQLSLMKQTSLMKKGEKIAGEPRYANAGGGGKGVPF